MVKDTGLTKQQLHDWAKTENELKQVCQPEEIAGWFCVTDACLFQHTQQAPIANAA